SLARGRGVSIWLGVQSLGQLEARYGKANAQTILSNCSTKIALSGLDFESADYISKSLGERTVSQPRVTRHGILRTTYSRVTEHHSRKLLTRAEVRRIGRHQAIVISGNRRPMMIQKIFYDEPCSTASSSALGQPRAVAVSNRTKEEIPAMPEILLSRRPLRR